MKKNFIALCTFILIALVHGKAQTIQEGINHLYADRVRNAERVFKKLLEVNPNSNEAIYWLGQTYLDMDDNDAARQLYDKSLVSTNNAPLVMVGRGHVHLLDKKIEEARKMFDAAITATSSRRGNDPDILNAVGRAHVDSKNGNFKYAVQILLEALERTKNKNADIALNLGNAYRKEGEGTGGGKAYESYKLATEIDPNFAYPFVRIAKLYETQQNWSLVLDNLNKALYRDPNFSLAYYEMFYYHFFRLEYDMATEIFDKYVASRTGEDKIDDDYLHSQLCWAKKDYDCAIQKAESVKAAMGARVKPRVYKQLAYSYLGKQQFSNAKINVDEFFNREKEGFTLQDHQLKADIYSGSGASCSDLFNLYTSAVNNTIDTLHSAKINFLNAAAEQLAGKNCKKVEADMKLFVYKMDKDPNPAYLVNYGINYYQAGDLVKADSLFAAYVTKFPDSIYGHYWRGRVNFSLDTSMTIEPFVTNMLNGYVSTLRIAKKDKERLKSLGTTAALLLTGYYNNIRSSRDTAYAYVLEGLEVDSTNAQLKNIKEIFDSQMPKQQKASSSGPGSKPSSFLRRPSDSGLAEI